MRVRLILLLTLASAPSSEALGQTREGESRALAARLLNDVHFDVKRSYYDKTFHGVDMEAAYDSARARLSRARSDQERFNAIDRYMNALNDSHTYFVAPRRIGLSDFNFGVRFQGSSLFVVSVDAESNAAAVGLRAGDEIVQFAGQAINRENAHEILLNFLGQHPIRPLDLTVRAPDQSISKLTIPADTAAIYQLKGKELRRKLSMWRDSAKLATSHVQATIADTVFYWRLPHFEHADRGLNDVMKRANKHPVLVLDLRGNPGGSIETLTKLVGYFVEEPLTVGDLQMRAGSKLYVAKPVKEPFTGRMLILVDSETGSAAEIFARLMQLAEKATVYGDRTAGAVMAAHFYQYTEDAGAAVTVSDFILHNGERLEKVGVKPDVSLLAPPQHMGTGTDVVLSFVLAKAGARVSPAAAAQLVKPK
jgi:C-terminal processing protease CtpA/Prc